MTAQEIAARLAEPFEPQDVRWLPKKVSGNRALAIAYVDARAIMDRLDDVVGVCGWKDRYTPLSGTKTVSCRLSVRIEGEWIAKEDVGGESEQPDAGDREKSAFSYALKRAGVKFGIGRYLYRLPVQWVDYDPQKNRFTGTPSLPAWALPGKKTQEAAKRDNPKPGNGSAAVAAPMTQELPKTGDELLRRIRKTDQRESVSHLIRPGELVEYIRQQGLTLGYPDDIALWNSESQIKFGWNETVEYLTRKKDGRVSPAHEIQLEAMCRERGKSIDELCREFEIDDLSQIREMHYANIMMKLRERPIVPITSSV